jgi:hypothetical protein
MSPPSARAWAHSLVFVRAIMIRNIFSDKGIALAMTTPTTARIGSSIRRVRQSFTRQISHIPMCLKRVIKSQPCQLLTISHLAYGHLAIVARSTDLHVIANDPEPRTLVPIERASGSVCETC